MNPTITILLRTSDRPLQFQRCLDSIKKQTYKEARVIVYDNSVGESYTPDTYLTFVDRKVPKGFDYNLFLNEMKEFVDKDSWFLAVDDDCVIEDETALETLASHLTDPDELVVFQITRCGVKKPNDRYITKGIIKSGRIDMSCFALHGKHKNIAYFDNTERADFKFILDCAQQLKTKFIHHVVANAGARSFGKKEIAI